MENCSKQLGGLSRNRDIWMSLFSKFMKSEMHWKPSAEQDDLSEVTFKNQEEEKSNVSILKLQAEKVNMANIPA